jgi:hypothetical protein
MGMTSVYAFVAPERPRILSEGRRCLESRQEIDFLITDSSDLEDRPSLLEGMSSTRNILSIPLLSVGVVISAYNIFGIYDKTYIILEEAAVILGIASTIIYVFQIRYGIGTSRNIRRGIVDDATVNAYAAVYTLLVSWLALRTSAACPDWLPNIDLFFSPTSVFMFVLSFVFRVSTLIDLGPYQFIVSLVIGTKLAKRQRILLLARYVEEPSTTSIVNRTTSSSGADSNRVTGLRLCS